MITPIFDHDSDSDDESVEEIDNGVNKLLIVTGIYVLVFGILYYFVLNK